MSWVILLLIIGLLGMWAYTWSNAYQRVRELEILKDSRDQIIGQLFDAINGEWETKRELYRLVAELPGFDKLAPDDEPISN